jgi:hypothetical protein
MILIAQTQNFGQALNFFRTTQFIVSKLSLQGLEVSLQGL